MPKTKTMKEINLVKAIVRYRPSAIWKQRFVYGSERREDPTRYLLLQKAKDKFFPENIGKWEFCGGLVKKTETSEQAIKREMKEEIGLKEEKFMIVKQLPALTKEDEKYDFHCDVYLIDVSSNTLHLSDEHSDYIWKKAEEIKDMPLVLYADLLLEFFNDSERYFN